MVVMGVVVVGVVVGGVVVVGGCWECASSECESLR